MIPAWTSRVDPILAQAARSIRLLGRIAPLRAAEERARLIAAWSRGERVAPSWEYRTAADDDGMERVLREAATSLEATRDGSLAQIYAARARELALDVCVARSVGTRAFAALAEERFAPPSSDIARRATETAHAWIAHASAQREDTHFVESDAPDPASLLSAMRAEVGRLKLPIRISLDPNLVALAATGDGVIVIAPGRLVTREDVARTVVHEVHGHALPRARAATLTPRIFAIGTARGTEEQEGLALVLEERGGFLLPARKRVLAARHITCCAMKSGATFVDAVTQLIRELGVSVPDAITIAERAYRGGYGGETPGVGRDRTYIEAYLHVRDHLIDHPEDLDVIASGQIGVTSVATLAPLARLV